MDFLGVRVGFKNCFGVSLYRLISFVISVWLYKSYIGSELKSKVSRWTDGRTAGRPDGYVKIMPLVAPTPQLRLRWTELSWSVGAECGKKTKGHFLDKVFSPAKLFTLFDPFFLSFMISRHEKSHKQRLNFLLQYIHCRFQK